MDSGSISQLYKKQASRRWRKEGTCTSSIPLPFPLTTYVFQSPHLGFPSEAGTSCEARCLIHVCHIFCFIIFSPSLFLRFMFSFSGPVGRRHTTIQRFVPDIVLDARHVSRTFRSQREEHIKEEEKNLTPIHSLMATRSSSTRTEALSAVHFIPSFGNARCVWGNIRADPAV